MRILHWDKKRSFPKEIILHDWRRWAAHNGYVLDSTVPLTLDRISMLFEVYKHPDPHHTDAYLLYHPPIGDTTNTEVLCILPDRTVLNQILEAEKQMALSVMRLLQQKDDPS
ncbi:hypothetical protein KDH_08040 [Dictyobacter sp. S3.2.2.5]|uniref:Uncharacterized protein n=1 Tax=Dictyobacter halimunensis TaxID=3026934 RepID=A0ABQ6FK09_9CHLR|nr:hypothetical protein KDH_08040 [Dictyobacter sp. S3.2.2.5]